MSSFIEMPNRTEKPRKTGITSIIDNGVPTSFFKDVINSHSGIIDLVKFGWGTSLVTKDIREKIDHLNSVGIDFHMGGSLFEKAVVQGKVGELVNFYKDYGCKIMEVSDGTIDLKRDEKVGYIKEFSKEFTVVSEVGYKESSRSLELSPAKWIEIMKSELDAGAAFVITESRESGTSGICRPNGEVRFGLIEEIIESGINLEQIIFEAPNKNLQTYFVKKLGSNVNLANIAFTDVVALETLRMGLRSDTLEFFGGENNARL